MPRISFTDIRSLPDAIPPDAFELVLGNIPGAGPSDNLTLKCQTAVIPGFGNQTWDLMLASHKVRFRGKKQYSGDSNVLGVTYVEDKLLASQQLLRQWHESIVDSDSGAGLEKTGTNGYALDTAELRIYNQQAEQIDTIVFFGFFLENIQEVQLDGTNTSGPMMINATFSFDRFQALGTN